MSCRPDWIRLVGHETSRLSVFNKIRDRFGEPTRDTSGGQHFKSGKYWEPGIQTSYGHRCKVMMVDIQGAAWAVTPVSELIQLVYDIMHNGFHFTRIDLAVDHVNMGLNLCERIRECCEKGQLCHIRKFSYDPEFKADGTPTRKLVKLGSRSSDISVRVYDKGLETGTLPVGQWERLEVEVKGDRANEIGPKLILAGDDMPDLLWRYVIGAFDFREVNGRSELARRPRVKWWDDYMGQSVPLVCPPCTKVSTFESWKRWFQTSVGPRLLQLSGILGVSPYEFLEEMLQGVKAAKSHTACTEEARSLTK